MSKLEKWDVEDQEFWKKTGKPIATRNLIVSIPNLLCGFSVWLYWGMITKIIQRVRFANSDLFNFTWGNDGQPYDENGETVNAWVQNAAMVWVPIMVVLAVAAFFLMNNLPQHKCGSTIAAMGKYLWLQFLGFVGAAAGVSLLLLPMYVSDFPVSTLLWTFIVLIVAVLVTLGVMKFLTPKAIKEPLNDQFAIFKNKHTWIMT